MSDNGSSDWIALRAGENLISATSGTWGGSTTLALEVSDDGTDATKSAMKVGGVAVSLTGNGRYVVDGPGYVRGTVANYSGSSPIKLKRLRPSH